MAEKSGVGIVLDELALPVTPAVRAAGELLGIDPLHVANEGKAVLGVRAEAADAVLAALRAHPLGRDAAIIGTCTAERIGAVILDTGFGRRLVPSPKASCCRGSAEGTWNRCIIRAHPHAHRRRQSGIITIDRPARFNSLDVRTAQDLRRAGLALARDDDVAGRRAVAAPTACSAAAPI